MIGCNYSLVYVFTKCEKTKRGEKFCLIADQYYGDQAKKIKGFCQQLIDGDGAFAALYNITEGELGVERTLKQSCCGKDTSQMLVAGVDFTVEMLYTFSQNKQYMGRSILGVGHDRTLFIEKGHLPCSQVVPNNCCDR